MARAPRFTLSVGTLVSKSFGTYFRNFVPFTLLAVLVMSPWIAYRIFLDDGLADAQGELGLVLLLFLGNMFLQLLLSYVLTGAVTYGVVQQLRGEPASLATTVSKGIQVLGTTIGTGLLCGIRIFGFSLLLLVPGIIEMVKLYAAIPTAIIEGKGANAAIERSQRLTEGSRWPIFGSWLITYCIAMGATYLVLFALILLVTPQLNDMPAMVRWVEIPVAVLSAPFGATMMAVCYSLLRQGKENVDTKQLAAVFD